LICKIKRKNAITLLTISSKIGDSKSLNLSCLYNKLILKTWREFPDATFKSLKLK